MVLTALLGLSACGGSTDSDGSGAAAGSSGGGVGGTAGSGGSGGFAGGVGGSGGIPPNCAFVGCCDASGKLFPAPCDNSTYPACPPGATKAKDNNQCEATCSPSQPCASTHFCDYPDNLCGQGQPGKCEIRPKGCYAVYQPVCGCDGAVSGNDCEAYTKGSDVNAKGACTLTGYFACGEQFCSTSGEYCERGVSDVGGEPDSFKCMPLPSGCPGGVNCACLTAEPCGSLCEADAQGNITLTCPGG